MLNIFALHFYNQIMRSFSIDIFFHVIHLRYQTRECKYFHPFLLLLFFSSQPLSISLRVVFHLVEVSRLYAPSDRTLECPLRSSRKDARTRYGCGQASYIRGFSRPRRGARQRTHNGLSCDPREIARGRTGKQEARKK